MAMLGISVDVDGPMKAFKDLRENQIPFTIARALTMTANDCRDAARAEEGRVFQLRNDWTQRRTLTQFATKQNLTAQVYTDTENRRTGAPDYMPLQDEGGTKRPNSYSVQFQGKAYLAVPTKMLRRLAPGVIPAKWRPSQILPYALMGPLTRGAMRARKHLVRDGMYYFIVPFKSGAYGIMARAATDSRDAAWPMYILTDMARIKARHPVDQTVMEMAPKIFPENFSKAAEETIANDLLRGSGVSVRL